MTFKTINQDLDARVSEIEKSIRMMNANASAHRLVRRRGAALTSNLKASEEGMSHRAPSPEKDCHQGGKEPVPRKVRQLKSKRRPIQQASPGTAEGTPTLFNDDGNYTLQKHMAVSMPPSHRANEQPWWPPAPTNAATKRIVSICDSNTK